MTIFFTLLKKVWRHIVSIYITLFLPKLGVDYFYTNYTEAKEAYLQKRDSYNYKAYLMKDWENNTNVIEEYFLNSFSYSFLRHPLLKSTMFAHLPNKAKTIQIDLLKTYFSTSKLREILEESLIGSPILNDLKNKTSGNSIHHLYHLVKFAKELDIKIENLNSFIELGGGYGNMAKLVKKINPNATYTIIDIPIFSYIQYVYLSTLLGTDQVIILNKNQAIIPNKINLVPFDESLEQGGALSISAPDVFLSTWALSESNIATQALVRNNNYFSAKYLILAYQKTNDSFEFSQEVTNLSSSYTTKYNSVTDYLADNFYLFAEMK